ncbi:MAG: restriction endonuclease [Nitrospirae bacterium]|nr:restriction endonuclease [Nitrospirota bacterium]MBF0592259.1 restriction endonuclease [Nitrospirota bacterium]
MKYAYEDLSPEQFEKLIFFVCQRLLGMGVQSFSKGPDGGRDAKFKGTAELIPSKAAPWKGTVIIQAKHTNGLNMKFSEPAFFSKESESSIIAKEIPKIKKLKDNNEIDHYMLFSNRRLSAGAESEICRYISEQTKIANESIRLYGIEEIEGLLKQFPDIARRAEIDPVDSPLMVSPADLADVIISLAKYIETVEVAKYIPPVARVSLEKKNQLNNMTPDYDKCLREYYLKDTNIIDDFLAAPENQELLESYNNVVEEFQLKIIAKHKGYQTFDDIMNYLTDLLFKRDADLKKNKRLTRAMLFYMYWSCDIGKTEDVETY